MLSQAGAIWQTMDERVAGQELPRSLDAIWDMGAGMVDRFVPRRGRYLRRAEKVLAWEKEFSAYSDGKLRELCVELRGKFRRGRDEAADMERAFAVVREVAYRQLGERPFAVQVAGAFALESGCVAEMATGEGKTLTASLAATVAGWRGRGCHIVTVNDYLAQRDSEWMGRIYHFCGLSVGLIQQQMKPEDRRRGYMADVTYATNKEVTADFLRDQLILGRLKGLSSMLLAQIAGGMRGVSDQLVQRGLNCALVDEADSILIDEAVTPLIISGEAPNTEQVETFKEAAEMVESLAVGEDYVIDRQYREINLTRRGKARVSELTRDLGPLWRGVRLREEMATQALMARELFVCDKHYVVDEDKVVIVDEFTGRLMPDRNWRDGLHQAIEAKEQLEVTPPKATYARLSFQRFFRMYRRLAGMTGTAREARAEFWQIYHLPVVVIPPNRPCVRDNLPSMVLATEELKWRRLVASIEQVHQTGRPILVGTRSVKASEYLSELLQGVNLKHQVLNAVYHHQEAQIVAGAGQAGKITVATNMAGRGTDIKLGRGVAELGGLHVISGELNESARIDRQLYGRGARQGDPGSAQAIVSLEDEFVGRYTKKQTEWTRKIYKDSEKDISSALSRSVFWRAQQRAERMALRQRKTVLKTDHWLDEQLGFAGTE